MSGIHLQLHLPNLNVDLRLPARGIIAVTGASGSGKTTLLRAVAGLEKGARGRIDINGAVWQDDRLALHVPAYRRGVGFVFQEPSLFAHLSVRQNIEFGMQRSNLPNRKIAMDGVIELLGIGALLQRNPSTLSGGESQRVAIARALVTSPLLLLMDEPLAALDLQKKAEVLPYLDRLHQEFDIPVLYVSHALDEVAHLADHVVMLEAGKELASGSVFDMVSRTDLALSCGDHASSLILARVIARDEHYQLTQTEFSGGNLWLAHCQAPMGQMVRLRIEARDVSLSLYPQRDSSILNSIAVRVSAMHDESGGLMLVELDANSTRLLARITRRSADQLQLQVGAALFAQIKGVAILK